MPPAEQGPTSPTDPTPSTTPQMNAPTQPPFAPPAPKKSRGLFVMIAALVVIVAAAAGFLLWHNGQNSNGNGELSRLKQYGSSLTASQLNSLDKTALFYAVFQNAAEQQNVTTTTHFYQTKAANDQPPAAVSHTYVAGYSYPSKQFAYEFGANYATGDQHITRCIGSTQYEYDNLFPEEGWTANKQFNNCSVQDSGVWINDGLNAGGLSASQASTFVSTLKSYNFVTVRSASLVTVQGKPYVRFDVSVRVIPGGHNLGMGYFETAFEKTGLDARTWPYTFAGTGGSAGYFSYFVDPATQLPAYSQILTGPSSGVWDNRQVMYDFGSLPSFSTNDTTMPAVSWPVQTVSTAQ